MELTIAQRVQRGIALMDGLGPENWRSMIDLCTLDIGEVEYCVIGQIYGDYIMGRMPVHIRRATMNNVGQQYGLDYSDEVYSTSLTDEWVRVLSQ